MQIIFAAEILVIRLSWQVLSVVTRQANYMQSKPAAKPYGKWEKVMKARRD